MKKNNFGQNEDLVKDAKVLESTIKEEDEDMVVNFQREIFKEILKMNILEKNLVLNFAQTEEQKEICNTSIKNSERALEKIDTIKSNEIILHYYQEMQANFGRYISAMLSMVSGTFADDRVYKDDEKVALWKKNK